MSDHELEQRIASIPTRELPAESQRKVLQAILAADRGSLARWWARRIPLWQAAAVWLILTAAALTVGRLADAPHADQIAAQEPQDKPATLFVAADPTVFGITRRPAYRMDIARWAPTARTSERKVEP